MDKQYSVQFFTALIESVQKICREHLDYEQSVDISGYISLEIDNYKRERYVLSELLQNTGNVFSESYCTKAFKTQRRSSITKSDNVLRERRPHNNASFDSQPGSCDAILPRNAFATDSHSPFHHPSDVHNSSYTDQNAMSADYLSNQDKKEPKMYDGISEVGNRGMKRISSSLDESIPSAKTSRSNAALSHDEEPPGASYYSPRDDHLNASSTMPSDHNLTSAPSISENVRLPVPIDIKQEIDDCVLIDSGDEAQDGDLQNVLNANDSNSSFYDNSSSISYSTLPDQPSGSGDNGKLANQKPHRSHVGIKLYSKENLLNAVMNVVSSRMSIKDASRHYRIPMATLYAKLPRANKEHCSVLTPEEEKGLVQFALRHQTMYHTFTKRQFLLEVKRILDEGDARNVDGSAPRRHRFNDNMPDYNWLTNFCKRNPDITKCFPLPILQHISNACL